MWKALFVRKIFKSIFFGVSSYVRKRLDEKSKANFSFLWGQKLSLWPHRVVNNYYTNIFQYI